MEKEKVYIFPENYNKKEKFLGIIEYRLIILIAVICSFVFYTLKYVGLNIKLKVCLFIVFAGLPSIFVLIGVNGENMIDFIRYIFKFLIKEKVYVYRKTEDAYETIYKKLVSNNRS